MPLLNDTLWQDVRYACRLLKNSPGFAAIAILSLALGIGANTAIFSIMDAVMLKYLPVRDPGQLYQITAGLQKNAFFTNPIWEQVRDRQDVFSGAFAWSTARFNVASGGEVKDVQGLYASGGFFSTLGVSAIAGRTFAASDDRRGCPGAAVISYGFWQQRYGGDAGALGKTISLDGHPFPIIGVTPPSFFGVDVGRSFDVAIPICAQPLIQGESALDHRSWWWLQMAGRLKPGVTAQQAEARMRVLAPQVYDATTPQNWRANLQQEYRNTSFALRPAASGTSSLRSQYRNALFLLMIVVALVLLIACANIANLTLARASARQREIAVRLAVGASRGRLIRQLLTESLLLSLAGAALGVLFAIWGAHLLVRYISSTHNAVDLPLGIDLRMLGFTAAVAILTGLLFGLAPAFRGTHLSPNLALKESSRSATEGRSKFGLGRLLVIAQVTLSLVLLIGAGLFVRSFYNLATLDAGFQRDHVLLVNVDIRNGNYPRERWAAAYEEILERLRGIPGVRSASEAFLTPISHIGWNQLLRVDGHAAKSTLPMLVWFNAVSPGYLQTMGTPLLTGRDFNSHDILTSPQVAIVNETMARKFFANRNPLGQIFRMEQSSGKLAKPISVVGIMKDAKYGTLRENTLPTAFVPVSQQEKLRTSITYQLRTAAAPLTLTPFVTEAVGGVNKNISLEFNTLATQVNDSLIQERLIALLSGFFGALALLLATVGLYGVMSYMVTRRRNEIGIRMALGAERRSVLRLVLREAALLTGAGVIAGGAAALATTHLVTKMLFGLKPDDASTMAQAAGILIAVAAVAGYLPARRAASLDPMAALREE